MKTPEDPKRRALRKHGTLNPHPKRVIDSLFREREFFDPRDLLQVKYEMLRWVEVDAKSVSDAARSFGFSRPSFYLAQTAFAEEGLVGLVPKKRGPRHGHKVTEEVLMFLLEVLEGEGSVPSQTLVERVRERFGLNVHRRTIERALARKKKPW